MKDGNVDMFQFVRDYWVIITMIGSIIIGWNTLSNRVEYIEKNDTHQNEMITNLTENTTQLSGAIIEIKANYLFIKEKLEKLDK